MSRSMPWRAFAPLLLIGALLWLAAQRDWGSGARDAPYLGALVVLLGVLPAVIWSGARFSRPEEAGRMPFLPVIGVLYALYFGLPVLIADAFETPSLQITDASLMRALRLALLGWLALLAGWTIARRWLGWVRPVDLGIDRTRARAAAPYLIAAGFAAILAHRLMDLPGGLVQPVNFLKTFFQIGLAILVIEHFGGRLERGGKWLLWAVLLPAYLFFQVGDGSVAQLVYAGMFVLFIVWGLGRRVPLATLALGVVVVLLMRGHVHSFREQTWQERGAAADAGAWQRSTLFVGMLSDRLREDPGATFEEAFDEVSARVAHAGTFAHVVHLTPERVPYWGGATYAALPTTIVPRAFWPDKPTKETGQAFGHRYELLGTQDKTTAINLPIPVEFYANFGARGLLLGMFGLGVLFRLLHRWWNDARTGHGTLIIGSILFSRLILIESDFTLVYGAVLQYAVLLFVVVRWLGGDRRASSGAALERGGVA